MLNLHLANMNEEIEKRGLDEGQAARVKKAFPKNLSEKVRRATMSSQCPTVAGKFDPALTVGK